MSLQGNGKEIPVTKGTAVGFTEELGSVPTLIDWLEPLAELKEGLADPDVAFRGPECFLAEKVFDELYSPDEIAIDYSGDTYVEREGARVYRLPTQPVYDPGSLRIPEPKTHPLHADQIERDKPTAQRPNFKKLGRRNWKAKRGRR